MSVTLESVERINALKNGIEATTGETYADLTEGVQALKNGYGQGGGTEEIENIIDESGVLGTTDETVTVEKKVEQLVEKSEDENLWYEFSDTITERGNLRFYNYQGEKVPRVSLANVQGPVGGFYHGCSNLKRIEFYINTAKANDHDSFFDGCSSLEFIKGINTSSTQWVSGMLNDCISLKTIEEPLDLTYCRSSSRGAIMMNTKSSDIPIENIRFVSNTIYFNFAAPTMPNLSAESVQSLFDGLNPTVTGQVLTLPPTFNKPEAEAVVSANIEVVDGVTRIKGKEGWTLVR